MKTAEQNMLATFDLYIDDVFGYFYSKTRDREVSKALSQQVFKDMWDYIASGKKVHSMKDLLKEYMATAI